MNTYQASGAYSVVNFDLGAYEIEVEKGRRRIVLVLLISLLLVVINIATTLWALDQQTQMIEQYVRVQLQLQHIPDQEKILKQMTEVFKSPTYPVYVAVSQVALYLIIMVLPWVAIYLGKQWARSIVGLFAMLQGIAALLGSPLLAWFGFYGYAALLLAYGAIKLYIVYVLFSVPSVKKYFKHVNL